MGDDKDNIDLAKTISKTKMELLEIPNRKEKELI